MDVKWVVLSLLLAGCAAPEDIIDDSEETGTEPIDLATFGVNGDPFLGDPDAAVQVVSYEAPGCGNCRFYHANGYVDVKEDFIDTGKIGYHYLQWSVGYAYDRAASIALECAHREGGTEAYLWLLDEVFANQHDTDGLPDRLDSVAAEFTLDAEALQACYENEETVVEYNQDRALGRESGAGSNPGFAVIKGGEVTIVHNAQGPYDAIAAML